MKLYKINYKSFPKTEEIIYYKYLFQTAQHLYFVWEEIDHMNKKYIVFIDQLQQTPTLEDIEIYCKKFVSEDVVLIANLLKLTQIYDKYKPENCAGFDKDCLFCAFLVYEKYLAGELEEIPVECLLTHPNKELRELVKTNQ